MLAKDGLNLAKRFNNNTHSSTLDVQRYDQQLERISTEIPGFNDVTPDDITVEPLEGRYKKGRNCKKFFLNIVHRSNLMEVVGCP